MTIKCSFKTAGLLPVQYFHSLFSCNDQACHCTELGHLCFHSPSLCNLFGSEATGEGLSNQQSQWDLNLCLIFCHHSPSTTAHPFICNTRSNPYPLVGGNWKHILLQSLKALKQRCPKCDFISKYSNFSLLLSWFSFSLFFLKEVNI